jgi:hypothetical protein
MTGLEKLSLGDRPVTDMEHEECPIRSIFPSRMRTNVPSALNTENFRLDDPPLIVIRQGLAMVTLHSVRPAGRMMSIYPSPWSYIGYGQGKAMAGALEPYLCGACSGGLLARMAFRDAVAGLKPIPGSPAGSSPLVSSMLEHIARQADRRFHARCAAAMCEPRRCLD